MPNQQARQQIERLILIAPLPLAHMYASAPTDPYEPRNLIGSYEAVGESSA